MQDPSEQEHLIQRNNQQQDIGSAQNTLTQTFIRNLETSIVCNCCFFIWLVLKVLGIAITLIVAEDTECDDKPLLSWCIVYASVEVIPIILTLYSIKLRLQLRIDIPPIAQCFKCLYGCFFLAWFIVGNVWYFSDDNNCDNDAPVVNDLTLALLILGYIFITLPCCLCLICCFCVSGIVLLRLFGVEMFSTQADEQTVESALKFVEDSKRQWNSSADNTDICPICQNNFEQDEWVVNLRCKQVSQFNSHIYHVDCINQWIRANPICPSCRQDIVVANQQPESQQPAAGQQSQDHEAQHQERQASEQVELMTDILLEEESKKVQDESKEE